ncbi:molybdopterin-dependent oxidoreductase [Microbacterium sediminicola]|uniref:Molybdopterin-dependent oxidoreductase n=1 Tax=Microbacterium sediminicola TaxID=415210 RepID=A0ABN2IJF9_9MICO
MRSRILAPALAAVAGLIAAGTLLAVSELAALPLAGAASPLLAAGSFVVDIVPRPLKEFAITTFGTADKPVLLASLGVAAGVAAALIGILARHTLRWALVLLGAVGLVVTVLVVTRAGAGPLDAIPTALGTIAAAIVLAVLIRRLRPREGSTTEQGVDRRGFFLIAGAAAAGAVIVGVGARALSSVLTSVRAAREALRIPSPRTTVTVPAGAEFDIPGLTPLFTSNADFYRVDTALSVPEIDPGTWRLRIDGLVDRTIELDLDDLFSMGLDEYAITLTCVSNEVGGNLVGNATWLGVPVRDVLRMAGPQSGADMLLSRSVDGYTASTPLSAVTDDGIDAILAVAMNGEPLPLEHGFPVRMVVPGLYGYVSATKWLTGLTVTTFADDEAYWTPRGYSARAPMKFSSRVDTPKIGSPVPAGTVPIAGVAWAQTVGIERVEVQIDDGPWQHARLSQAVNNDTWVQWMLPWEATPGTHYLTVRAVNRDGEMQIEEPAPIAPNGSSGWQRTLVTVR